MSEIDPRRLQHLGRGAQRADNYHQQANDLLDSVDVDLLVSPLVIDEVAH